MSEGGLRGPALPAARPRRPARQRLPPMWSPRPELLPPPGEGRAVGAEHRLPRPRAADRVELPDGSRFDLGAAPSRAGRADDRRPAQAAVLVGRAGAARGAGASPGGAAPP